MDDVYDLEYEIDDYSELKVPIFSAIASFYSEFHADIKKCTFRNMLENFDKVSDLFNNLDEDKKEAIVAKFKELVNGFETECFKDKRRMKELAIMNDEDVMNMFIRELLQQGVVELGPF